MGGIIGLLTDIWLIEFRNCVRRHGATNLANCRRVSELWWEIYWLKRFLAEPKPLPIPFGSDDDPAGLIGPMFRPSAGRDAVAAAAVRSDVQGLVIFELMSHLLGDPNPQPNNVLDALGDTEIRREVAEEFAGRLRVALKAVKAELASLD